MLEFTEMYLALVYLALCVVNGLIADQKGRYAALAMVISLIFTPIVPYLYLLAVPSLRQN